MADRYDKIVEALMNGDGWRNRLGDNAASPSDSVDRALQLAMNSTPIPGYPNFSNPPTPEQFRQHEFLRQLPGHRDGAVDPIQTYNWFDHREPEVRGLMERRRQWLDQQNPYPGYPAFQRSQPPPRSSAPELQRFADAGAFAQPALRNSMPYSPGGRESSQVEDRRPDSTYEKTSNNQLIANYNKMVEDYYRTTDPAARSSINEGRKALLFELSRRGLVNLTDPSAAARKPQR